MAHNKRSYAFFVLILACLFLYGVFSKINIQLVTNSYIDKHVLGAGNIDHVDNHILGAGNVVTVIIPLEEIKQKNRERAIAPLLKENVSPDDPRLIQAIRDHFIDPPSTLMSKISLPLAITPQAKTIDEILHGKRNGFYIECGALDGERSSNSIYFERKLNWKGILIEMDPSWYRQIEGKNRKAHAMNACLSPHQYPIKMDFQESSAGTGRLVKKKSATTSKPVFCFPILSVMLAMKQTHIDYFSLDVEGLELEILQTIPFDKLDITTFSVEYEHAAKKGRILKLMVDNGYLLHSKIDTASPTWVKDYIFVKKSAKL